VSLASFAPAVDVSELRMLQKAFAQAPQMAQQEMTAFMHTATAHLQAEAQTLTPTTHGTLRASIIGNVTPLANGIGVEGVVGSGLAYALPVELGTKPHMPPIEPLVDWAKQKFALDEKAARSTAWAVAKTIAKRGTLGVGMFHRAFAANRGQLQSQFEATVRRIAKRLGEGVK
jgi:hypothetical protein